MADFMTPGSLFTVLKTDVTDEEIIFSMKTEGPKGMHFRSIFELCNALLPIKEKYKLPKRIGGKVQEVHGA